MRIRVLACLLATLLCVPAIATAQTSAMFSNLANPALGANALFTGTAIPNLNQPYGLGFDEAEISLISVVDPYWTFVSNIVFVGDGSVDPEEVWVRSTNIPSLQIKLGKLRGTFGKHGLLHTHAFPFVEAPIIMSNTIGNEGFKDPGVELAWLTPVPWFFEVTGGAYQATDPDHPLDFGSTAHDNIPVLAHVKSLSDVNESTTMELGASLLQGHGSDGGMHGAYGADLTFRNVPARNSNRRGWILMSEYIQKGSTTGGTYGREADGGYVSFQYRLSQVWWAGIRGERARNSLTDFVMDDTGAAISSTVNRGSVNLAWTPSEFSFIRLEYSHAKSDAGIHPTDDRILIQMSYTIGYHPAHAY
jgi:hypothetical protein